MPRGINSYVYTMTLDRFIVEVHELDLVAPVPMEETRDQLTKALGHPGFRGQDTQVFAYRQFPSLDLVVLTKGEQEQLTMMAKASL